MEAKKFEKEIFGKKVTIEAGKIAKLADGSVTVRIGDSIVLVTACGAKEKRTGVDFLPLTVDIEERMYSAGKIPGGFIKREGRPSEKATLTARLIDRPLRPTFPTGYTYDTQIIATVLTTDQVNPYDILALNGASTALTISDIPFEGPVAAVRVGRVNNELIVNPTYSELDESDLDLVVAGTREAILMIEAGASEISEADALSAIALAKEAIVQLVDFQLEIAKEIGKPKREVELFSLSEDVKAKVESLAKADLIEASKEVEKLTRDGKVKEVKTSVLEKIAAETLEEDQAEVSMHASIAFNKLEKSVSRARVLDENTRADGRKTDEIRPITAEAGFLPRARIHGSGLFTRGQTQALTVLTLGTMGEDQMIDGIGLETSKRYMHHYNFPPYSTGEAYPMRGTKRREIGHGALAERALVPVIPDEDEFPYTIRLVSDIMASNGSSSMASVCGSTLALLDAGVPIKKPVAGIAMGLIKEDDKVAVLSDILGSEDAIGDMDFKVAGTKDGITAIQMDMKISGVDNEILTRALEQAREGRLHILGIMTAEISEPREEMSENAPRVITVKVSPDKIGDIIGPGGKIIKGITEATGATIDIEQDGTVFVSAKDGESAKAAVQRIEMLTKEVKAGEQYDGTVVRTAPFGAFVEILPGKDGLVHVSKLSDEYVKDVEEIVKVGDKIKVEVLETDKQGKISLKKVD